MVRTLAFLCTLLWFSAGTGAAALPSITGQITLLRILADGPAGYSETDEAILLIYVAGIPLACGSSPARVAIGSDHPMYESILSTATTAYTAGRDVQLFWREECTAFSTAWDLHALDMNP